MRSTFDNPKGVLFPNQFVNVRLLVDTMTGATLAPNAAIQLGASGDFVYLLKDDSTVAKRDIAIGPTNSKHTVITSGLAEGDKVVIDGVDRLRDGAKVKIVDPAAAGAGQAGAAAGSAAETNGGGQHHKHRHDQSGAADNPETPAAAANPPAPGATTQGAAPGGASSTAPAPASPGTQEAAPSSAPAQGAAPSGAPAAAPAGAAPQ
jgi:multidrug efflux system membrane fusion protein